jgi:hypothetical protein
LDARAATGVIDELAVQAAAISSGGQATWGFWIVGGIAFVLLWSAIIIFVVFTVAAVMKLVRSMSTG